MDATHLGESVRRGLEAMRAGEPHAAIEHLLLAAEHPEFERQEDMRDLYARVCSVLAQCLLETGEPGEAQRWLHRAMRVLRDMEDSDGIAEIQALNRDILTALIQRRKAHNTREDLLAIADTPVEELLASTDSAEQKADKLIQKANGEFEAGRHETAVAFAEEALAIAIDCGAIRETVFAQLSIARAEPKRAQEAIYEAWAFADKANEHNLVSIIATAATQAGVPLPSLRGPDGSIS